MVSILLWNLTFVFEYEIHVRGYSQTLNATYIHQTLYSSIRLGSTVGNWLFAFHFILVLFASFYFRLCVALRSLD